VPPSPQLTSTDQGPSSAPGSVNEPRSNVVEEPSFVDVRPSGRSSGVTLAMSILKVFVSDAPSLSVTLTVTSYTALSVYVWSWLPRAPVLLVVNEVCAVPSPQVTSTLHRLSAPGSVSTPRLNGVIAPSVDDWSLTAVSVGATFLTCTVTVPELRRP